MARLPAHDGSPSGLSSAETFTRKGKADRSCMSALCEGREERRECMRRARDRLLNGFHFPRGLHADIELNASMVCFNRRGGL